MFDKSKINLQPITVNCDTILSSAISTKDFIITGKYQYRPSFIDKNLKSIKLYFRVKYNDTNSAVMKNRMEFATFLENSRPAGADYLLFRPDQPQGEVLRPRQHLHLRAYKEFIRVH